jgi:hypothetical protein
MDNARQAAPFWRRHVRANPEDPAAKWALFMTTLYLRGQGEDLGKRCSEFRKE